MEPGGSKEIAKDGALPVLGRESFKLSGDVHRVVTFLNKTLKDSGLIFGLSRPSGSDELELTIYRAP